jgi:hypothetical protein
LSPGHILNLIEMLECYLGWLGQLNVSPSSQ